MCVRVCVCVCARARVCVVRLRWGERTPWQEVFTWPSFNNKQRAVCGQAVSLEGKTNRSGAEKGRDGFPKLLMGWGKKHKTLGFFFWLPTGTMSSQHLLLLGKENPSSGGIVILPKEGISTSGVNPDSPKPGVVIRFQRLT